MQEEWREIKGYEGLYSISNFGRVKSHLGWNGRKHVNRDRILSPWEQRANKYYSRSVVSLRKDGVRNEYKVHRLVAEAFIPNPLNLPIVNHLDGNPLNNVVTNLEWCTHKENLIHALDNEFRVPRIKTIDRDTMVDLLNNGYSYDEISGILGIAKGTVCNYIRKFKIKKVYV